MMGTHHTFRRAALIAAAWLVGFAAPAAAQDYPTKAIRFVTSQAAGGTADVMARLIGQKLADSMGQQVIVDNRPGANGIIGMDSVAKSPPDGYTIVLGTAANLAVNAALYKRLPYDPVNDMSHIALVGKTYYALLVPTTSPANTLGEFIAMARAKPGHLNYGAGSSSQRAQTEIFSGGAKISMAHIPYKSNTQAMIDLMGGRVDLLFESTGTAMPAVKSGKAKVLAITSPRRLAIYPDLPTVAESGVPGYEWSQWVSINGPAGIPPAIINKLTQEIAKVMANTEVIDRLRGMGLEPFYGTPDQASSLLKSDVLSYKKAFKDAGIPQEE